MHLSPCIPKVVLDTNVVLDWLLFRNPHCDSFHAWLASGRMRWIANPRMRGELAHVISRGDLAVWQPTEHEVWSAWHALCEMTSDGVLQDAATRLRCTDPDDQKFIDLALSQGARWLLSRDRAVLRLARRARPLGLDILTPAAWSTSVSRAEEARSLAP